MERLESTPAVADEKATEPTPAAPAATPACHNCGAPIAGPYCSNCGQEHGPLARSLREIARDWTEEVAAFDSRIIRTLMRLFLHPGGLTVDYHEGRRIRYVPPIRLYMVASVVYFFVLAIAPGVAEFNVEPDDDAGPAGADAAMEAGAAVGAAAPTAPAADTTSPAATFGDTATPAAGPAAGGSEESEPTGFDAWIIAQGARAAADEAAFNRFWVRVLAWSMVVFMPVAALMLAAAYRRQKRYYVHHLVFTLHTHAFVHLVLALAIGLRMLISGDGQAESPWPMVAGFIVIAGYTYSALLRVYGESIIRTAVKFGMLACVYVFALTFVMAASALIALSLF